MSIASNCPRDLFQGARFWLSLEVPQRSRFKELITKYGGHIVLMENDAHMKLVDHKKKNIPAGCYSYQYIEECLRQGELVNRESHRAGSSKPRAMGASNIPKKGTRAVFTVEDDQLLYDFLQPFEQEQNAPINGNKIYQLLEKRFPVHTWQSFRTRYLRRLRGNPRPGGGVPRLDLLRSEPDAEPRGNVPTSTTPPKRSRIPAKAMESIQQPSAQPGSSTIQPDDGNKSKRKHDAVQESPSQPQASPSKKRIATAPSHPNHDSHGSPRQPLHSRPLSPATMTPTQASKERDASSTQQAHSEDVVDTLFLELPFLPSSPRPDDGSSNDEGNGDNDMIDWVERQVSAGIDDAVIDEALCCTSLNCELAEKILRTLAAGNPIPDDIPGVWTPKDDEDLEGQNARGIKRVLEKHGEQALEERWKYMSEARDRGMV